MPNSGHQAALRASGSYKWCHRPAQTVRRCRTVLADCAPVVVLRLISEHTLTSKATLTHKHTQRVRDNHAHPYTEPTPHLKGARETRERQGGAGGTRAARQGTVAARTRGTRARQTHWPGGHAFVGSASPPGQYMVATQGSATVVIPASGQYLRCAARRHRRAGTARASERGTPSRGAQLACANVCVRTCAGECRRRARKGGHGANGAVVTSRACVASQTERVQLATWSAPMLTHSSPPIHTHRHLHSTRRARPNLASPTAHPVGRSTRLGTAR